MSFNCTGCGLCCLHVDRAAEMAKINIDLDFPYTWDANGRCEKLDENHKCTVYENRPLLCNVERFAEVYGWNKEEFYRINEKACKDLQREADSHLE